MCTPISRTPTTAMTTELWGKGSHILPKGNAYAHGLITPSLAMGGAGLQGEKMSLSLRFQYTDYEK